MNWALATPQYHFGMAVIALLALGYSITIHRKSKLQHKVLAALCKLLAGEIVKDGKETEAIDPAHAEPEGHILYHDFGGPHRRRG